MNRRTKVTVVNAYAVHPVDNGGRYRLHGLYKALARHVDVDLVTLGLRWEGSGVVRIGEGLRELRVARSEAHEKADLAMQSEAHAPVYDIAALANFALTPDYLTVLENSLAGSAFAVVTHPYMANALRHVDSGIPFVHESHNQEHVLKSRMLPASEQNAKLLALVEEAEGYCCREARLVYACSEDDAEGLARQYGAARECTVVIHNGTDTDAIAFSDEDERLHVRRRLRLDGRPVALFLASGHRPNLDAAEHLFKLAGRMPDVAFAFVGNLAYAYWGRSFPENVWMVGFVSDEARNVWLQVASVALNPMLYGGGTNLKLLDYFAAGTPVISTPIGIRGAGVVAGRHARVAEMEDLEDAIRGVLAGGADVERMTREARTLVEEEFDWRKLGDRLHDELVRHGLAC